VVRWLSFIVAAIVLVAIAAVVALPRVVDTPRVQSLIASSATQALARPVKFRSLSVSVLPYPAVRLGGLEVAEDPGFDSGPFLRLDDARLRLKLWPLLRGRVEFATLVLRRPTIALIQGPDGRWNFASLGAAREPVATPRPSRGGGGGTVPAALVSRILVEEGLATYETRAAGSGVSRQRLEDLDLTLSARSGGFSFSGSARVMPGALVVKISDGALGLSGARALTEASVRASIAFEGRDVRPLVTAALGPEPTVSGSVMGRLNLTGTVGRPRATGDIELQHPEITRTNPACPEPRRRRLALSAVKASVTWDDGRLLVPRFVTGLGPGSITSKLAATPGPHTHAELSDLVLKSIPLEPVLVDFLCQAYAVAGPLDLRGTLDLSPADPMRTLSGSGRLSIGQGRVLGAHALTLLGGMARLGGSASSMLRGDSPATAFAAPLDFESIVATWEIRNGVVTTRDLLYTSRAMKVKVVGDYALPTGRVNLDVVLDHGRGQLLAKVTGTSESPSIRVAPAVVLRNLDPAPIERGFKDLLKKLR
jgi:uncharacterized protein involved in outer membrane biogenesis